MQKREEEHKNKESYCCPNPNCNSVFYRPKIIKYYVCPTCQTLLKMDTAIGNTKTKKQRPTEEDIKRKEAERLEAERKAERLEAELLEAEQKAEQLEAERLEAQRKVERIEAEREEAKLLEAKRLKAQQLEAQQMETRRLEAERKAERLEAELLEAEQKAEQLEAERLESERKAKRLESELKAERLEAERKAERLEAELLEPQRLEAQRKVERLAERLEAERKETEKQQQIKSEAPKPIELSKTGQPAASSEEVNKSSDSGCKYYFGYLSEREKGEEIPAGCLECRKSLDCMLSNYYRSKEPITEIKKWYHPRIKF